MSASTIVLSPSDYTPDLSLPGRINRRLTQWRTSQPLGAVSQSIITFSFDDFPKSAADTGAEIMDSINAPAIYYACTGLAGRSNITGAQYEADDLLALAKAGHEIGAHTHSHLDCARTSVACVLANIERNLDGLKEMGLAQEVKHFAYPYGETQVALKKALIGKFDTCRGILPGQNQSRADRMQLRAMELSPDEMTTDRALYAIERATSTPTWLHIFTHDVRLKPSNYGVTPNSLMLIARAARDSGLLITTPTKAMQQLSGMAHV
jgi:peptidoglycan/xylan/chitin deacetylase (PgdA/CDA1 family)